MDTGKHTEITSVHRILESRIHKEMRRAGYSLNRAQPDLLETWKIFFKIPRDLVVWGCENVIFLRSGPALLSVLLCLHTFQPSIIFRYLRNPLDITWGSASGISFISLTLQPPGQSSVLDVQVHLELSVLNIFLAVRMLWKSLDVVFRFCLKSCLARIWSTKSLFQKVIRNVKN